MTRAGQIGQMGLPCRCQFRCQGMGEWLRRHGDFLTDHKSLSLLRHVRHLLRPQIPIIVAPACPVQFQWVQY